MNKNEEEPVFQLPFWLDWIFKQVFGRFENGIEKMFTWSDWVSKWRHARRK